jgi:hypothetical protein
MEAYLLWKQWACRDIICTQCKPFSFFKYKLTERFPNYWYISHYCWLFISMHTFFLITWFLSEWCTCKGCVHLPVPQKWISVVCAACRQVWVRDSKLSSDLMEPSLLALAQRRNSCLRPSQISLSWMGNGTVLTFATWLQGNGWQSWHTWPQFHFLAVVFTLLSIFEKC